jgi:hypothetical protein
LVESLTNCLSFDNFPEPISKLNAYLEILSDRQDGGNADNAGAYLPKLAQGAISSAAKSAKLAIQPGEQFSTKAIRVLREVF